MATAENPYPQDEELISRVLADPEVIARLDRIEQRRVRGELVTHSHEEVLEYLRRRGLRPASHLDQTEDPDSPTS